jgi:hypothetical protein
MKHLNEYLTESKKTYEFKIGIAGELPEGFETKLKTAMEKFQVVNMSKGKKTPIQERPLDFPSLENTEVTYFEAEVNYPTTQAVLQEYIAQTCTCDLGHVLVRSAHEAEKIEEDEKADDGTYTPVIGSDMEAGESAQESVGDSRVMNLLKELETARKEKGDSDFKLENTDDKPNSKSAVGS